MKFEDLLKEQVEELEGTYDIWVENNKDNPEVEIIPFGDWVEGFDYGDDDFFCTADRSDRWMDIVFPYHRETMTFYNEELRALEQMMGRIIYDYDDLVDAIHKLVDREVDKFQKYA